MPLYYIKAVQPNGVLSIWKNGEPLDFYSQRLDISSIEKTLMDGMSPKKREEWLSSRYLLHMMTGRRSRAICRKDEYGKPIIEDSDHHISISHSGNKTAVIASLVPVGIDIQKIVNKINRISRKFCNEIELSHIPKKSEELLYFHIIWGAKECIYKSYGKRKVDFKDHMTISHISNNLKIGTCMGTLAMNEMRTSYKVCYELLDDYMLVYTVEE